MGATLLGDKPQSGIAWVCDQFPAQLLVAHTKQQSLQVSYTAATNAAGAHEAAASHSLTLLVCSTPASLCPTNEAAGFIIIL